MAKDTQILTNSARFKFSEEKDDFRGSLKIESSWVYISRNSKGDVLSYLLLDNELKDIFRWASFDLFSLSYIELEGGTGKLILNLLSSAIFKGLDDLDDPDVLPKWYDDFLILVDGQRIAFDQFGKRETGDSYELIKYSILVEDLSKITNASEIKFSLRGENHTIEGNFVDAHIKIFKAFEQYCFGDKDVANEIINKINQELDEKSERIKQIEEQKKQQQETKSKEKIQTYLDTSKKNRNKNRNILIFFIIILVSIALYQNFKKSEVSSSSASSQKVFINDKPGSYLVSEQIAGGAVLFNVDKKTKKSKKLPELSSVSILKVEDSLGYFDTYYGDEGKISAGWVNMKNLVPSDGYLTYSYGEKFWVKSDLSQVVTYKDYFKEKLNKKKLKGMDEIEVYLIKDGLAYFNNGILDDYFKGWIEADKIEKKK